MQSAIYSGWVRHRRHAPQIHEFRYELFMLYLDLAELPEVFDRFWLWSARRPAPARFKRSDYLGGDDNPVQTGPRPESQIRSLDAAVRDLVAQHSGRTARGPIRMLTHLRYLGYCFNPVTFYYCFDAAGARVETIVAEITNTPWKERHTYVLPVGERDASAKLLQFQFDKRFHVSPFMPMNLSYDWRMTLPEDRLIVHMENWRDRHRVFDATLNLEREAIDSVSLARALLSFPLMTAKVSAAIYWQALRLWIKRAPIFTHPESL